MEPKEGQGWKVKEEETGEASKGEKEKRDVPESAPPSSSKRIPSPTASPP